MPEGAGRPYGVERRGLRDQVYDSLLGLLMGSTVKPGERLGIDALAAMLNVSPTPVREALVQLERTGLVTREGFKGYRVAEPLTESQMQELMDVREMLEVQGARWAVRSLPAMLPDLRSTHAAHARATAEVLDRLQTEPVDFRTYRDYFAADEAFHQVLLRGAANLFLVQIASDLGAHQHRMRQTIIHHEFDVAEALAEHEVILRAAESADGPATVRAVQQHMKGIRARSVHGLSAGAATR